MVLLSGKGQERASGVMIWMLATRCARQGCVSLAKLGTMLPRIPDGQNQHSHEVWKMDLKQRPFLSEGLSYQMW